MAKKRTMNELRQTKEYQGISNIHVDNVGTSVADTETIAADGVPLGTRRGYSEIDVETTKDIVISKLGKQYYDIIFQAVCDEMAKHEVFQEETYFTPQGIDEFVDAWFEFFHEHHGDILHAVINNGIDHTN